MGTSGANILAEVGRKTSYADADHPGSYELGGFYNTSGPGTTKGSYAAYGPATAAYPYQGGKGLFFRGQQAVWRVKAPRSAATPKNISVFGGIDLSLSNPQPSEMDAFGGLAFTGFMSIKATGG
ncbi:MAG: carbohydrate porin [Janthinobacterium lividum]